MANVFTLLFLLALGLLVWGLTAPTKLSKLVFKRTHKDFTRKQFGLSFGAAAAVLFILVGITAPQQPPSAQSLNLASKKSTEATSKTSIKTVTDTKTIPFTSTTVQDSTLAKGTTEISTKGVNGVETLTYQDTYSNGTLTAHKLISDVVTTQPIAQVTSIGTYVASTTPEGCTNGTYVNSEGNTVCSPESAPSAPAGATAQCVDGTYSFSQSRSGTCSRHGGVAQWL